MNTLSPNAPPPPGLLDYARSLGCFPVWSPEGHLFALDHFYLSPDFSQINLKVVVAALGQAFFSMSLGMGAMITYGSYISKRDNLVSSAGWVCFSTTLIAILAGLIIFPTLFDTLQLDAAQFKKEFEVNTGLMFQVLPIIISKMPGGYVFGILFFVNQGYVMFLITDERGNILLAIGLLWLFTGFAAMAKMVRFEI